MKKLYIVGIGPGAEGYILPEAKRSIEESDVLIGGKRNLEIFKELNKEKIWIGNNLEEICQYILGNLETKSIAVVVTGDPGLYSILGFLKERLTGVPFEVIPGVSSLQYLCCKKKTNWNDLYITSLHGREQADFIDIIKSHPKVAVFTGGEAKPGKVCKKLIENGICDVQIAVGENLSYGNERIVSGPAEEIGQMDFEDLSIMLIEHGSIPVKTSGTWEYKNSSISDELFTRGNVPMTKEEVRAVSISKLRLKENCIVFDIGAGTGSVAVECALRCAKGKVYAVEKNREAIELIHENSIRFGSINLEVVEGEAPVVLTGLPEPDRVFIGGSSGNMESILEWVKSLSKAVRVVINAVTPESVYEALKGLEENNFLDIELVNISVSRGKKLGGKHLMQALNPVYIISAEKRG
ncbi:MAG: precorrin-6y C5,15-methyltransferase (decarboxylating) subunit CbiE [Clostridia bacterium]|nr:precorrin-6y C5,15-methyltransferase (decarboxylating) subunit CbiE [Clostridia bacterium]